MKHPRTGIAVLLGLAASVFAAAIVGAEKDGKKTAGLPPLKVDRGAPLLLDEPKAKEPAGKPAGRVADNSACHVCHGNYQDEPLAVEHARGNVGCIKCHGASLDHRNDEDNITPPDKMYPAAAVDKACRECHDEHNVPAVKIVARWQERCAAKGSAKDITCTDCHGAHRLKLRTVRWDKQTKKLLGREIGARSQESGAGRGQ